jgi:hypothetical protein
MKTTAMFLTGALLLAGLSAQADPWITPGDARLRHDIELLADAGIIRAPVTAWPMSWGEVARDVSGARLDADAPGWMQAALERVQGSARRAQRTGSLEWNARIAASEAPMALRRFGDTPRESGEVSAGAQFTGRRFAYRLQATAVVDPDDDKEFRADGSYVAAVLGNWMLHAGNIDRWWGPGWEGSLILGTNARPLPSITFERNYSDPSQHPALAWIGRWRFVTTMGQFEGSRDDAPDARFFGARFTVKPLQQLEIGISRSAQWCGDGRPCSASTFWDLIVGNDNDQPSEEQPGNQMGGFDLRWAIPRVPVALYAQAIGEDEAGFFPSKYLGLGGAEVWGGFGDWSWRAHVEYADTACDFAKSEETFGCAYRNAIYSDGYQYRNRSLGHALDGDSEQWAGGLMLVDGEGRRWELAFQDARVNRAGANPVHSVALDRTDIRSADLYHRRALLGGEISLSVGFEERSSAALDENDVRGFVEWRMGFQ